MENQAKVSTWFFLVACITILLGPTGAVGADRSKILYVNSYHAGYPPSDGMETGALRVLQPSGHEVKIIRMDTKRNASEAFKVNAGTQVKRLIDLFQPDVVITTDDNAIKYLFLPFFADSDLPFVFSGVNWSFSQYGGPYRNLTGMLEVALIDQLITYLKPYCKGSKIGYMSGDIYSERRTAELAASYFDIVFDKVYFVSQVADWRHAWVRAQQEVDVLIFENNSGIAGWHDGAAKDFILANTTIPVGATNQFMAGFAVICVSRDYEEQGAYPATIALEILNGRQIERIPIVRNRKAKVILNMKLAKAMKLKFPITLIENAALISAH